MSDILRGNKAETVGYKIGWTLAKIFKIARDVLIIVACAKYLGWL